jgi:hypothetical protein
VKPAAPAPAPSTLDSSDALIAVQFVLYVFSYGVGSNHHRREASGRGP